MRTPKRLLSRVRLAPIGLAALALVLTGCSGDSDEPEATSPDTSQSTDDTSGSSDLPSDGELAEASGGNPDRAFGSTDEAVIKAVVSAVKAEKAEWDGTTLRAYVDGSIEDPTAGLHCSAIHAVIADYEQGVFVYPDGEFDCEERR